MRRLFEETIEYVEVLREVISILSGDAESEWIARRYGRGIADVIDRSQRRAELREIRGVST